ncbi:MAG: glycosyltransferase family 4 protein [Candidatus Hydrogenedentes bacterium]|nr:glycosyltransferase family 4 protein [Candidatus Hydrogenedentota bacterium]
MSQSPASDPLRIVGVTKTFPTAARPDAGGFFVRDLNALVSRGHAVSVAVATGYLARRTTVDSLDPRVRLEVVRHLSISRLGPFGGVMSRLSFRTAMRALGPVVRSLTDGADALYAKFLTAAPLLPYAASGARRVISVGEGIDSIRYRLSWMPRGHLRSSLDFADAVEVRNADVASFLADGYCDAGKIHVVPSGVDTGYFTRGDRAAARAALGLPTDAIVIAHVGQRNRNKGGERVIAAAKSLATGSVVVAIAGRGWDQTGQLGAVGLGLVGTDRIRLLLQASDVFAFPSISEGMPNALLEAMACGVPCVAADKPYAGFLCHAHDCLMCDPESVESIAAAIARLIGDPELRYTVGKSGRETAQRLSSDRRVHQVDQLLRG